MNHLLIVIWTTTLDIILKSTNPALNGLHYFQIMSRFILVDNDKLCFPIEIFPKKVIFVQKTFINIQGKEEVKMYKNEPV